MENTRAAYGSGSVKERAPGVHSVRWRIDGRQYERTFRGTKAAANRFARTVPATIVAELGAAATPTESDGPTFGDVLTKYIEHLDARGRAPKTIHENGRAIEMRIRPRLGEIPLSALSAEDLDDAYSAWLGEGLSQSSVHRYAAVVSAALSLAVRHQWIKPNDNPASVAEKPPQPPAKTYPPTPDQVSKLIHAADEVDRVMSAAIVLGYVTGARRGEICALKWSDVDLDAATRTGTIRIEKSLSQVGDSVTEKSTKTGNERTVEVDGRSVELLLAHRVWQEALADRADSPLVEDPYILSDNANGARPIPPSKITDRFTALRGRAGVNKVRFHDLRHANNTEKMRAGIPILDVSADAGHSSSKMTLDLYGHASTDRQAGAKVMGALLPVH